MVVVPVPLTATPFTSVTSVPAGTGSFASTSPVVVSLILDTL